MKSTDISNQSMTMFGYRTLVCVLIIAAVASSFNQHSREFIKSQQSVSYCVVLYIDISIAPLISKEKLTNLTNLYARQLCPLEGDSCRSTGNMFATFLSSYEKTRLDFFVVFYLPGSQVTGLRPPLCASEQWATNDKDS